MQLAFARLTDLAQGLDEFGQLEPVKLPLTAEAEDRLEAFARDMVERCHEASGLLAGTLGKARGHALRLSAVLEHLWWCGGTVAAEPKAISPEAVTAAADLLNAYFVPMAERVFGDASIPVVERRGMLLARHLRQNHVSQFNAREVRRQVGGMLRDAADMEAACRQLVEANLIRQRFARAGEGKGRKALNYEVHPEVLADRPFAKNPIPEKMGTPVPAVPLAPIASNSAQTAPKALSAQGGKIFSEPVSGRAAEDMMVAAHDAIELDPAAAPRLFAEMMESIGFDEMMRLGEIGARRIAEDAKVERRAAPIRNLVPFEKWRTDRRRNKAPVTVFNISSISRCVTHIVGPLVSLTEKPFAQHKRYVEANTLSRIGMLNNGGGWPCWIVVVDGDQSAAGYTSDPDKFDAWFQGWVRDNAITIIGDWREEARKDGALDWLKQYEARP